MTRSKYVKTVETIICQKLAQEWGQWFMLDKREVSGVSIKFVRFSLREQSTYMYHVQTRLDVTLQSVNNLTVI